jgi:hypothetical protein
MPLGAGGDKIGDWDVTTLTKVIRDILDQQPTVTYEQLVAQVLSVSEELKLNGKITLTNKENYTTVGSTGASAFANSWVNFGAPYYNAAYWIDPFNFVHLRGVIKNGTVGNSAFTLPPGYRPSASLEFWVLSNGTNGRVTIASSGTVTPVLPSNNASVVLDQIIFKVP